MDGSVTVIAMGSGGAKPFEVFLFREPDGYCTVGPKCQWPAHKRRELRDQREPLGIGGGRFASIGQVAPRHGRAVHQLLPAPQLTTPFHQIGGWQGLRPVIGELGRNIAILQPLSRLHAGAALCESEELYRFRHSVAPLRFWKRCAITTKTATSSMKIVASALISGFKPSRTREKTSSGSVVYPGPVRKDATTTSSSDSVKASSHAASKAGAINGSTIWKNTLMGDAPRSSAASSIERSRSRTRDWMITETYAMLRITCPTQMVNAPLLPSHPSRSLSSTNIRRREMPSTTSGITNGALASPTNNARPRKRPARASTYPTQVPITTAAVAVNAAINKDRRAASSKARSVNSS